jgi:hypothetical protein
MTCTPQVIETKVITVGVGARGPAGPSPDNLIFVDSLLDLPASDGGVRRLPATNAYLFTKDLDFAGDRIVCEGVVALLGTSSETATLRSTGLVGVPFITSAYTLPIQNLAFEVDYGVELNSDGTGAIDWRAVNFLNTRQIGNIRNYSNFILTDSAFLNSGGLVFGGTTGTIAADGSLFTVGAGLVGVALEANAIITRRFRVIFSSFVAAVGSTAISFPETVSIPTEGYILDSVNFAGGGTYSAGVEASSNSALFFRCTGISNTSVSGQMYTNNNVTATAMTGVGDYVKLQIPTTASPDNQKYLTDANNRLTCNAVVPRRYLVQATVSFTSGNNNVVSFGFYDSVLADVRQPSRTKATANSGGRAENISMICVIDHGQGDYIELWATNLTTANQPITITDCNVVITQL